MKKRILAIILMLMLAVSLLPAAAMADGVDYVSVNGTAFERFGQTIKCGSGTATLKGDEYNPEIVLKNAQITKFANMGTYEGITTYAGIVFIGDSRLEISLEGKNTITAPSHSSKAVYAGVVTNQEFGIFGATKQGNTLGIKGVDIGIEATSDVGSGMPVGICKAGIDINASQVCIYSGALDCAGVKLNLVSGGNMAAICDGEFRMEDFSAANISLSPVLKNFDGTAVGISASGMVGAFFNSTITVNMNADARGVENFAIQGIAANTISTDDPEKCDITVNLNVKSDKSGETIGIYCDKDLYCGVSSSINANLSFSGEHGQACGIIADNLKWVGDITSTITGAGVDDAALAIMSNVSLNIAPDESVYMGDLSTPKRIYASVDNANTQCGAIVHGFDCTGKYGDMKIVYPNGGSFALLEDGEDNAYIVKDAKGNPAAAVVITDKDYAFRDIDDAGNAPYKNAILWAVDQGITNGFTPVEFRPSAECTRGQVVTFLWRAKGCPEPNITENPFVDVSADSPYYKAILWAFEQGITTGYDETHFSPDKTCTRGQVVTFLWRCEGKPAPETMENPFEDVSAEGYTAPYYEAILWAAEQGITTGYDASHFCPDKTCNRGQVVTFIYRDMAE